MRNMTLVDNRQGFGALTVKKASEYENKDDVLFEDIDVFGESPSPDCPQNNEGGFCHKYHKMAFFAAHGTWKGKDLHIGSSSALPPHKIKSIASWNAKVTFNRINFINFKETTELGMEQRAFQFNPYSSDLVPIQEFYNTRFINCEENSLAFFLEPPQKWAIIKDCGAWPCTAPKNTFFSFINTTFEGIVPSWFSSENPDFQMIPDTVDFSRFVPDCIRKE